MQWGPGRRRWGEGEACLGARAKNKPSNVSQETGSSGGFLPGMMEDWRFCAILRPMRCQRRSLMMGWGRPPGGWFAGEGLRV